MYLGMTAVLRVSNIEILILSKPVYEFGDEPFRAAGLDWSSKRFFVVKNPMNYLKTLAPTAVASYILDTPGPTPATLRHARYQRLSRPYFPADDHMSDNYPRIYTTRTSPKT